MDNSNIIVRNNAQASASGDAMITTSYSDDYAVQGYEWTMNDVIATTGAETITFLINLSQIPEGSGFFLLPIDFKTSEEITDFYIYEDTDYVGGVVVEPINRNRITATQKDKNFIITTGATGTTKGTELFHHVAFGSSQGVNISPSGGGSERALILDTSKNYIAEFVISGTTKVEYDVHMFEVPFE